jgi:hypothetical protein
MRKKLFTLLFIFFIVQFVSADGLSIIDELINSEIILHHGQNYGYDRDDNNEIVTNEVITIDPNGKAELGQILDFLSSEAQSIDHVDRIEKIIRNNQFEYPEVLERIKEYYLPKIEAHKNRLIINKVNAMINQANQLQDLKNDAIEKLDSEKVMELSIKMNDTYQEIVSLVVSSDIDTNNDGTNQFSEVLQYLNENIEKSFDAELIEDAMISSIIDQATDDFKNVIENINLLFCARAGRGFSNRNEKTIIMLTDIAETELSEIFNKYAQKITLQGLDLNKKIFINEAVYPRLDDYEMYFNNIFEEYEYWLTQIESATPLHARGYSDTKNINEIELKFGEYLMNRLRTSINDKYLELSFSDEHVSKNIIDNYYNEQAKRFFVYRNDYNIKLDEAFIKELGMTLEDYMEYVKQIAYVFVQ